LSPRIAGVWDAEGKFWQLDIQLKKKRPKFFYSKRKKSGDYKILHKSNIMWHGSGVKEVSSRRASWGLCTL